MNWLLAMLETADKGSHRGDPPVFCNSLKTAGAAQETRKLPCMIPACGSQTKW
jgi:hypothetical protein